VNEKENASTSLSGQGKLAISGVSFSGENPRTGLPVLVTCKITAKNRGYEFIQVYLYDARPSLGGKLFDAELIPYIKAGDTFTFYIPYCPSKQTASPEEIYVRAVPGDLEIAEWSVQTGAGGGSSGCLIVTAAGSD